MRRFALFVLLVTCLGTSCRKKEKVVDRYIPAGMKAYWDFKEGSWWVYQDSATGNLDTVTVTYRKNYKFDSELSYGKTKAHCEFLEIATTSTSHDEHRDYWINTSYGSAEKIDDNAVWWSRYNDTATFTTSKCFMYPLTIGNATYDGNGFYGDTIMVKHLFDSLWGYNDVVQINQNYNMVEGNQHTRTYWAKNVGIVKHMLVDSAVTKTLVSYHINL